MKVVILGEHQGDGIRYEMYLSAPAGGLAQMIRNPAGNWVGYAEYAALQAEVERLKTELKAANNHIKANSLDPASIDASGILRNQISLLIDDLKAENKKLKTERDHYQWASTNDGIACNERARENQDLENQIDALKAENDLLRKITDTIKLLHTFGLDVNAELDKAKSEAAKGGQP